MLLFQTFFSYVTGIANENGGITFFPVQVNVGAQPPAVPAPMQPLSTQALAAPLPGAALQLPGQVTVQQVPAGEHRQTQQLPSAAALRPRRMGSLSLFFRKVPLSLTCALLTLHFGKSSVIFNICTYY